MRSLVPAALDAAIIASLAAIVGVLAANEATYAGRLDAVSGYGEL